MTSQTLYGSMLDGGTQAVAIKLAISVDGSHFQFNSDVTGIVSATASYDAIELSFTDTCPDTSMSQFSFTATPSALTLGKVDGNTSATLVEVLLKQ